MSKVYAGIGSRAAFPEILSLITNISSALWEEDYFVRTGAADGCDLAFASGSSKDRTIYYLPWREYQINKITDISGLGFIKGCARPSWEAIEVASKIHPNWSACSDGAKLLHGRNIHIINGLNLDSPVEFVLCWTKDGLASGGTGLGINYAKSLNIPVFNLFNYMKLDQAYSSELVCDKILNNIAKIY